MTDAVIGHGTILAFGNGASPESFTALAEVFSISGPSMARESPDASHMASPGAWREFISGMKDPGEITVECNHLPGNSTQDASTGVLSLFASGARTNWRMTFPDGSPPTVWEFLGVVTAFSPTTPLDEKMTLSVTIKLSGQPDFLTP